MIYAIVGRPRSGKSYESVAFHIIPAIKKGRRVVTNIPLNIEYFVKIFGDHVRGLIKVVDAQFNNYGSMDRPFSKFEDYIDDWRDENNVGPLFVIDEAHMVIPSRVNDSRILEFYSMHGHYGIDIIILTQNLRKIHADIRAMIEMTYYTAKNTAFGSDKTYTKKVRIGDTREVINEEQRRYKKEYFKFYQSHTQSSGAVTEEKAADITPIWKRWPFWMSAVFLLTSVFMGFYFYSKATKDKPAPEHQSQPTEQVETPVIPDGQPSADSNASSSSPAARTNSSKFGPMGEFDMFVTGYSKQIARVRKRAFAEIDTDLTFYRIYIKVYQDKRFMFSFDHTQLQDMGYIFEPLAECVYRITWGESERILTCVDEQELQREEDKQRVFAAIPAIDV
ncbi:zonular occludens toxin domain-containing protein [Vibrio vulnificus]|uniref:zonular occludens toxin domain-containing protein n=1 Tax=Vibrio vulnificus TaxID=672 RepID=UPI00188A0E52|nr:zonular occludens toxin domain-containing protein [Vibrio vulnificus]MBF4497577.1 assembly protein [Vibrio vulnificus]